MRTATLQCLAAFLVHNRCSINIFGNDSFTLSPSLRTSQKQQIAMQQNCYVHQVCRSGDTRGSQKSLKTNMGFSVQTMALGYLFLLLSLASPHGILAQNESSTSHSSVSGHLYCCNLFSSGQSSLHYWVPNVLVTMPSAWVKNMKRHWPFQESSRQPREWQGWSRRHQSPENHCL